MKFAISVITITGVQSAAGLANPAPAVSPGATRYADVGRELTGVPTQTDDVRLTLTFSLGYVVARRSGTFAVVGEIGTRSAHVNKVAAPIEYGTIGRDTTSPKLIATETGGKSKGKWVSPEDAADADAKEIADSHRGDPSYESGRHGEGPRETARDIGELIKESEKAGKLPEYIERLKEIQKTFQDRARAGHPGGRR